VLCLAVIHATDYPGFAVIQSPPFGRSITVGSNSISCRGASSSLVRCTIAARIRRASFIAKAFTDALARPKRKGKIRALRPRRFLFGREALGVEPLGISPKACIVLRQVGAHENPAALGNPIAANHILLDRRACSNPNGGHEAHRFFDDFVRIDEALEILEFRSAMEGRIRDPPLPLPEVAFARNQTGAEKCAKLGIPTRLLAVVLRVVYENVANVIGMTQQMCGARSNGEAQTDDIAARLRDLEQSLNRARPEESSSAEYGVAWKEGGELETPLEDLRSASSAGLAAVTVLSKQARARATIGAILAESHAQKMQRRARRSQRKSTPKRCQARLGESA
jgi:hypothetical protein